MRLNEVYRSAIEAETKDVAEDDIDLIVSTAIRIGTVPDKMNGCTLMNPMEYLEKAIFESPYHSKIQNAVTESYMKFDEGPQDAKFTYIKSFLRNLFFRTGYQLKTKILCPA
jgi:hypothetical protein